MLLTSSIPEFGDISPMTTFAPSVANSRVMDAPIPLEPPVTNAYFIA